MARSQADIERYTKQRDALRVQAEKDLAYLAGNIDSLRGLLKPETPAETGQEPA